MTIRKSLLAATAMVIGMGAATAVGLRAQDKGLKGEPMRGTWGFSASGTIVPAPSVAIPAAAVGTFTFDPQTRNCVIQDTINVGGERGDRTSDTCSYLLGLDGRGSIVAVFGQDLVPLSFVLVDHERELRFIRTDAGVAEGVAKLQ